MNTCAGKKVILFGYDGIIMDSMAICKQGFEKIFEIFDDTLIHQRLCFHKEKEGFSQFEKIRYFYQNALKKEIRDEEMTIYANKFSEIMKLELENKQYIIAETISYIRRNFNRVDMHIVSGSENGELNFLCRILDIDRYFLTINGSPEKKAQIIPSIINIFYYKKSDVIMIGGAKNDWEAANEAGIEFWGYNNPSLKEISANYIQSFNDF